MKELLRTTNVYREFLAGNAARTTLVLFSDEVYLRPLLFLCAEAFFGAEAHLARRIAGENFPDCKVYPRAGEKLSVDDVSEIVEESLLAPAEGDKKLFVLDRIDLASALVQNKLLKILEEPPQGTSFLLGAAAEHAVLPTVLSRARKVAVPPFSEEEVCAALLRLHPGAEGTREAAAASGGVLSTAEALLEDGSEEFRLAEELLTAKEPEALCRAIGEKKEKRAFFAALRLVLRDALFLSRNEGKYCTRRSASITKLAEVPTGALIAAMGFLTDAEREIQFNANPGQAAYAFALRFQEEKAIWQKLSS